MTSRFRKREADELQYQWYVAYSRYDEYPKNPQWTRDIDWKVNSVDDDYTKDRITFFDRYDPQHIYITSDTVYNLFRMR